MSDDKHNERGKDNDSNNDVIHTDGQEEPMSAEWLAHIEEQARHGDFIYRALLAEDPGTPEVIRDILALDESEGIRKLVARRRAQTTERLDEGGW